MTERGTERPETGVCPNCGEESDHGYDNRAAYSEFDCNNPNCRCMVFRAQIPDRASTETNHDQ